MIDTAGPMQSFGWPLLAQAHGSFWLPGQDSTTAAAMDSVFYLILAVCAVFFTLVVGLAAFFVVRYARRPGVAPVKTATHNLALELFWSAIPLLIVGVIFWQGFAAYMDMVNPPQGCYEIRVTGQQWSWLFTYPNGYSDENLHVPVDEPVKLIMTSTDVNHGLSIPAFRVKMDLVPGRYTTTWFRAVRPGSYPLLCTEYCGNDHYDMLASVVVHPQGEFDKWLKQAADYLSALPPAKAGEILYQRRGCLQCHPIDPNKTVVSVGPPLRNVFGKTHSLADGSTVVVDDNYIRESILEPQAKVRAGYPPVMSTYKGQLSDNEITALIEYIKTLE